jgi:hypothetical protein
MIKLSAILTLTFFTSIASANCIEMYKMQKWANYNRSDYKAAGTQVGAASAVGTMVAIPAALTYGSVIPLVIGASTFPAIAIPIVGINVGVIAIHNARPNKMIKLIKNADDYIQSGNEPGKQLSKLHEKLEGRLSVEELASYISNGNKDLSLCTKDIRSFNSLKKKLETGDALLTSDDE